MNEKAQHAEGVALKLPEQRTRRVIFKNTLDLRGGEEGDMTMTDISETQSTLRPEFDPDNFRTDTHFYYAGVAMSYKHQENLEAIKEGTLPPYWQGAYEAYYQRFPLVGVTIDLTSLEGQEQ